jgi:hypothetical protein
MSASFLASPCLVLCVKYKDGYKLEKIAPALTDEQLDSTVKPIIQEYLEHGNTCEVEVLLSKFEFLCLCACYLLASTNGCKN